MKMIQMFNEVNASQIALGCMRIANMDRKDVEILMKTAMAEGINFFDHADIYGNGASEALFGEVLKRNPQWRKDMIIQTKCGIREGYYDFSKEHILQSVNASIKRLHCSYIDILLLHRPDTLMEPQEVADAFEQLHKEGKVKYFGVSNMNAMQMKLLQKYCSFPLKVNQLQFNPVNASMIDSGMYVNMNDAHGINRDGSILEYARLHDITIQPWSIMQASWEEGCFLDNPDYQALNDTLARYAKSYGVSKAAMNIAWMLRHPAKMQPIAGTTSPAHLQELCQGARIELTRPEWYDIYKSVGKILP